MARSLFPREHGAYAQLLAPLGAALIGGAPSAAGGLFAAAAIAAFAANEPLLVLLGHRGPRMREQAGARARRWLIAWAAVAVVAGCAGLLLASREARLAALIPLVPAAGVIALAVKRAQHSLAGEAAAAVALPSAAVPVAVAAGWSTTAALLAWAAWAAGYAASVVAIHRVIDRRGRSVILGAALLAASAAAVLALAPAIPLLAVSAALVVVPPSPRKLRAIGFALVGASLVSVAAAIAL